ncbi:MAG: TRAP transporter substrate-binding protein DctP [Motiliproteus sp.]|nr:TRAP transporter substrate-binding protein DctP [Motiliproteus sp.]MCW9053188.1 TRAP transporter substrate-binding protein DctP [Motiliproteus sp.]
MADHSTSPLSRRQFASLVGRFGLTSVAMGLAALPKIGYSAEAGALEATSASIYKKRLAKPIRHQLRFGAAHFTRPGLEILPNGSLNFIADLEERTDGEIRVEYIGGNQLCRELACTKMCINGEIDIFSASTQNASAGAPYFNIFDFAYMWPSRAAVYHFLYHPKSEVLLREPLRKYHGLQMLFSHAELRSFMMGLKYKDADPLDTVASLKGAKVRVTGTQLGRITMKLLGLKPVPVAWSDTLRAMQVGALDGAETWSSAVPYGNWGDVVAQDVHSNFIAGNAMTAMNQARFQSLEPRLQDAVMESAFLSQINVQKTSEAKLLSVTGISDPPLPGSYYAERRIRNVFWSDAEIEKARQLSSPRHNPQPWENWRQRLNHMAGGVDVYEELYSIANDPIANVEAVDIEPRRWWKQVYGESV